MGPIIVSSIQWNPSLVDTNGTYHCVQYTEESSLVDTNGTYHCVQYTVEPSLVDTDGTYHCVQYTVEPSLVDTDGTYHCVQYSPHLIHHWNSIENRSRRTFESSRSDTVWQS